jgi:uncharacterized membrane protein YagU involved in acid resistance
MNRIFSPKTIKAALLVGTLDLLAASIQFYIKTHKGPALVLKFIASGIFGQKAFTSGNGMLFYGLLFHFGITFLWTIFFFWLCHSFHLLLRRQLVVGMLYGVVVWFVMNMLVLPLSNAAKIPFNLTSALVSMAILMICMGIPLALFKINVNISGPSQDPSKSL